MQINIIHISVSPVIIRRHGEDEDENEKRSKEFQERREGTETAKAEFEAKECSDWIAA